jgi:hypothetical protein
MKSSIDLSTIFEIKITIFRLIKLTPKTDSIFVDNDVWLGLSPPPPPPPPPPGPELLGGFSGGFLCA